MSSEAARTGGRGGPAPDVLEAVCVAVAGSLGVSGGDIEVTSVHRLSGGASRLTWEVTTEPGGAVILQQERPGSAGVNLPMHAQSELVAAAASAGVPVPEVLGEGGAEGSGFVVLSKVPGESVPQRIHADPELSGTLQGLAGQVGHACARIHSIEPRSLVSNLPADDPLESMRLLADHLGEPHPAFEAGLVHLQRNRPTSSERRVVHGDLRMGNLLVAPGGLSAVLDWELAHLSSPAEDLGWFCARAWRFGSPLRAGGVGTVDELFEGYADGGGTPPEPDELDWWEAFACLRWGLICVLQASVHLDGSHRSVELAAIGRRAAECEEDLLELLWGHSSSEPPAEPPAARTPPHDAPGAGELVEAVVEQLEKMREQAEGTDRFNLRVAANALHTVRREIALGALLGSRHGERLRSLGVADDAELASAIRGGIVDDRDPRLREAVRSTVRDKLAVANPGYWLGDDTP